jgi:hypothetical protein
MIIEKQQKEESRLNKREEERTVSKQKRME